jgi:hypothetical protein
MTLAELKKNTIDDKTLNLTLVEIIGVLSCDNKEYIQKVIKSKECSSEK